MITLHSVSKSLGKGRSRRRVLDDINWSIQPRQQYVILGQQGAGKSTLLNIMIGTHLPSSGWVERKGAICPGRTLIRLGGPDTTTRQLSKQLAQLYHVPYVELIDFLPRFAHLEKSLDAPIRSLPKSTQQRLSYALIYAIPFDVYLFDGDIGPRNTAFNEACRQAFDQRCKAASMIVATSRPNIARKFEAVGGVLHEGKIHFFETIEEAISVFGRLPHPKNRSEFFDAEPEDEDVEDWV